jgi:hypothetical protein
MRIWLCGGTTESTITKPSSLLLYDTDDAHHRRGYVRGVDHGFHLVAKVGMTERTLAAQRGGPRRFTTLVRVHTYAHQIGLRRFEVDLAGYHN